MARFTKHRILKQALNNDEITEAQYEVVTTRYGFYNDSEWEICVADNSVYVEDLFKGTSKVY